MGWIILWMWLGGIPAGFTMACGSGSNGKDSLAFLLFMSVVWPIVMVFGFFYWLVHTKV